MERVKKFIPADDWKAGSAQISLSLEFEDMVWGGVLRKPC